MRRLAASLALCTSLVVAASATKAAPRKPAKHHKAEAPAHANAKVKAKAKPHAKASHKKAHVAVAPAPEPEPEPDVEIVIDDADDAPPPPPPAPAPDHAHHRVAMAPGETAPLDADPTDADSADSDDLLPSAPVALTKHASHRRHDWHVAVGPYLWASSVDAKVSLGGSNVGSGIDFFTLEKHAKFGLPLLAEAQYHRFSLVADMTYGVIGIDGGQKVGPLMVSLDGAASSLQLDSYAGYRVVGDADSVLALDARGGIRYERTEVAGTLAVGGSPVTGAATTLVSAEVIGGARVFLRPWKRVYFSGNADLGLVGSSSTWSAEADASVAVTTHVLVTAGYRTLTNDSGAVNVTMHGPRAALQVQF